MSSMNATKTNKDVFIDFQPLVGDVSDQNNVQQGDGAKSRVTHEDVNVNWKRLSRGLSLTSAVFASISVALLFGSLLTSNFTEKKRLSTATLIFSILSIISGITSCVVYACVKKSH